ncbi:MAG: hypothetical protein IPH32_03500 [Bacteroidetes bacterium]|nr:hypothetical protein [Bacteroidota bacterium]
MSKLTSSEKVIFNEFKNSILVMIALEKKYSKEHPSLVRENIFQSQIYYLNQSLNQLDELSEIQILRVKDLNDNSQKFLIIFGHFCNRYVQMLISSKSSSLKLFKLIF